MELKLHIGYQQLLELIKQLPASQLKKLKADIDLILQKEESRSALTTHFAEKVTSEMDALFESNQWGAEKIEEWSKEHMRGKGEE